MLRPAFMFQFLRHPSIKVGAAVWLVWMTWMLTQDKWHLFQEYGFVSITMAFGSFIAGATSEGGGAVAFPVLTIFFNIQPSIARDFSFAIQSVGMTAAAFAILSSKIRIEKPVLLYATLGGIPGLMIGLYGIAPLLTPAYTKMFFVSLWLSFGLVMGYRYLIKPKDLKQAISHYSSAIKIQLIALGVLGGAVTGITGSGIDIVVFSYLVLKQQLDIKIATPTSVILMAGNAVTGILMRLFDSQAIDPVTWNYWLVSIPIVVIGAPLGALFISTRSYRFVALLLCSTILAQFVGALAIVPQNEKSIALTCGTLLLGLALFMSLKSSIKDY